MAVILFICAHVIESRKDNVSKNLNIKGTKKNNYLFGHLFLLNRNYQETISNKLFFNYNPLRKINCLVYENNLLVINGYLQITNVKIDTKGNVIYSATISGAIAPIKDLLGDKMLHQLDLSDMRHTFTTLSIVDSWHGLTPFINPYSIGNNRNYYTTNNGTEYYLPTEYGKGYVYGLIDYANKFVEEKNNNDFQKIRVQNFRPQVYAKELLTRVLKGINYTFELQGSPYNIEKFNRLVVPDTYPDFTTTKTGVRVRANKGLAQSLNYISIPGFMGYSGDPLLRYPDDNIVTLPIVWKQYPTMDNDLIYPSIHKPYPWQTNFNGYNNSDLNWRYNNVFRITRDQMSSININLNVRVTNHSTTGTTEPVHYIMQLVKRMGTLAQEDDSTDYGDWEVISETYRAVPYLAPSSGVYPSQIQNIQLVLDNIQLNRMEEIMVRFVIKNGTPITISIPSDAGYFQVAKDINSSIQTTVKIGEKITPKVPDDMSQMDFFKNLLLMMNLYVYSEKENPRHLILKSYDDFYAKASPLYLAQTAINYSKKIDYNKGLEIKTNLNLPKRYVFQYTEDDDYLNSTYQDKHGEPYGTLTFNDTLGSASEKKIELKFAPTPPASIEKLDRITPFFTAEEISLSGKQKMKVKPRILYYSGVYGCSYYTLFDEVYVNHTTRWQTNIVTNTRYYPLLSMYYFNQAQEIHGLPFIGNTAQTPVPIDSLTFSNPKTYFFNPNANYLNLTNNLFRNHYVNQISELTNGNLFTLTCYANMTSFDINNMDLSTPIFIDMGDKGNAYFKVLSIDYGDEKTPSKLVLQKIV